MGSEYDSWNTLAVEVLNDPTKLDQLGILNNIQNVAAEHELDSYAAGLLYHSTKYSV